MINKPWKTRFASVIAISVILIPAMSQVDDSAKTPGPKHAARPTRVKPNNANRRPHPRKHGTDDDKSRHHHSREEFRKLMQAELKHVPALDKSMDRLMNIQAKRYDLQKKRQAVALQNGPDRDAVIKHFHALLRRDLELSEEARQIVENIGKDMTLIQKQLDERRVDLQKQLTQATTSADDSSTSSAEQRDFRRRMRYLDFLEKKLADLKTHPDRLDLLARVLRGLPFDDPASPAPPPPNGRHDHDSDDGTTQSRIIKLKAKRKDLKLQLRQVEKRLKDIR